jgi:predicted nucleic acid binding AN1-type Zn finger protein
MLCHVHTCVKKISLIEQTTCMCNKCSQYYCTKHRLMESHACSYDAREKKAEEIEQYIQANKCTKDKISRI